MENRARLLTVDARKARIFGLSRNKIDFRMTNTAAAIAKTILDRSRRARRSARLGTCAVVAVGVATVISGVADLPSAYDAVVAAVTKTAGSIEGSAQATVSEEAVRPSEATCDPNLLPLQYDICREARR